MIQTVIQEITNDVIQKYGTKVTGSQSLAIPLLRMPCFAVGVLYHRVDVMVVVVVCGAGEDMGRRPLRRGSY